MNNYKKLAARLPSSEAQLMSISGLRSVDAGLFQLGCIPFVPNFSCVSSFGAYRASRCRRVQKLLIWVL